MAQLSLSEKILYFNVIYFGRDTGENLRSLEILTEKAKTSEKIQLLAKNQFFLTQFPKLDLPNVGEVKPVFKVCAISNNDAQKTKKTCPFHITDGAVFVVRPNPSQQEENLKCFQDMVRCLNTYDRSLESISFIIQYVAESEITFFELRDAERQLNKDEFVSFTANLEHGEGIVETLEEIASDLIDEILSQGPECHSFMDNLLTVQTSDIDGNISLPAAELNPLSKENFTPKPSLPFYGDLPQSEPTEMPKPTIGPPSYGDLPQSLPSYGDPPNYLPSYGNTSPKMPTYGLPPGFEVSSPDSPPNKDGIVDPQIKPPKGFHYGMPSFKPDQPPGSKKTGFRF